VVEAVLSRGVDAPVGDRVRAALLLIERSTSQPGGLHPEDIVRGRQAGLSDREMEHVFYVMAMFDVVNRLADAFGFHVPSPDTLRRGAPTVFRFGYRLPGLLGRGR